MDIEIFADGFTARAIESLDEVNNCRGATGGLFYPNDIAKYCGMGSLRGGDIMKYGFRRFGYPITGWDGYKDLCQWIITTPMEGVFLTVTPRAVSPFGYLLKKTLEEKLMAEKTGPQREWGLRCHEWAKDKGVVLIDLFHWAGQCSEEELETVFKKWLSEQYPNDYTEEIETLEQLAGSMGVSEKDITNRFFDYKKVEYKKYADEYGKTHPYPRRQECFFDENDTKNLETPYWERLPEGSIERRIDEALYRAIFDLKRPVSIRDWYIAIDGKCPEGEIIKYDESGEEVYNYFAPVSAMAGYGVDPHTIGNEDYYTVQKFFREQFGSTKEGIKRLTKYLSNGGSLEVMTCRK